MSVAYIREALTEAEQAAHPEALRMDRAIRKLRDEVTGVTMLHTNGHSRELSLVLTKLDEAAHWAVQYLERIGQVTLVDRAHMLKMEEVLTDSTVATEATVRNGGANV